jgi:CheY-like chemotaxis protein
MAISALLLSTDLIFSSRVAQAARSAGVPLHVVADTDQALQQAANSPSPRWVILDLSAGDCDVERIVRVVHNLPLPPIVVAYAPHVQGPLLTKARQAGCDQVLTRGQFAKRLEELLRTE